MSKLLDFVLAERVAHSRVKIQPARIFMLDERCVTAEFASTTCGLAGVCAWMGTTRTPSDAVMKFFKHHEVKES